MKSLLFLLLLVYIASPMAGLPPTTLSGQSQATKPTTFNFKTPYYQSTQTSGATSVIETDSENLLINPSFEHGTVSTGWTLGTSNTLIATSDTSRIVSGAIAGALKTSASAAFSLKQCVTPPGGLAGQAGEATWWAYVPSGVTDPQICGQVNNIDQTCIPSTSFTLGAFKEYRVPLTFGTSGQNACVHFKTTASYATGSQTVILDKARIRSGSGASGPRASGFIGANLDIFSVSYGTTNLSTVCSSSPCLISAQATGSVTSITRDSGGQYNLNLPRTCLSLKCTGSAYNGATSHLWVTPIECSSCNTSSFQNAYGGGLLDGRGTLFCFCSY